ncbi:hypothetical protein DID88_000176 [Monilinia fructigena]|uniref:Reverse transcriptase n=1 Tax=Monilinia fructigena TaxID=38457 RepID=A0A395IJP6_9HELO|nr:hypothetical protein DID88_000176 [Monilinia fructigena]
MATTVPDIANNHKITLPESGKAIPVDPKPPLRKLTPEPASIEEITDESFYNTSLPPRNQSAILEPIETSNTQRDSDTTNFKAPLQSNPYHVRCVGGESDIRAKMIPNRPTLKAAPARVIAGSRIHKRPPRNQNVLPLPSTPPLPDPSEKSIDTLRNIRQEMSNIKFLTANSFIQFCKDQEAYITKVTWDELDRACELHRIITNDPIQLRRGIVEDDIEKFMEKTDRPVPPTTEIQSKLPSWLRDLFTGFLPSLANELPPRRSWDHKIEIMPGKEPPYNKGRPMSPAELQVVRKWLDDNLNKGFIRESRSRSAAPLLLAAKPGGGVRICQDYRGLNNVTIKNRYPLPLIKETLDALCHAKVYTKLDIIAAFNKLRIAEGHEWKTAFTTRFGLFESLVMPFGLCNAPASFQNYINHVLFDLLDKNCTAYLDDILIYSENVTDHRKQVREVVQRLIDAGLQIDIDKCEFETKRTKYLGLIITPGGIEMDPDKVKTILEWKSLTKLKDLQRFLGFANFYRRFIRNFSKITEPLNRLLKKENTWNWTADQENAFKMLKHAFASAPVLAIFDHHRRTVVETDASDWAAGGVLSQYDNEGRLRPVAYFSSKHSAAECNYEIYDKELLAIIKSLEEWRPELYGTQEPFEIITDHKNLEYFTSTKMLNQRQARWAEFLSGFNFRIIYRPGHKAVRPDALSRRAEDRPAHADPNDDRIKNRLQTVLPKRVFDTAAFKDLIQQANNDIDLTAAPMGMIIPDTEKPIDDLIDRAYESSELITTMRNTLQNPTARYWPLSIRKDLRIALQDCRLINGKIFYRDRLFVPPSAELRTQIIYRTHSTGPAGHPGRVKTIDLVSRTYWVAQHVKRNRNLRASLERHGKKHQHIVTVVCRLTKMRHFIPVVGLSAEELADRFVEKVYCLHGTPDNIVSDRGSQFVSEFWKHLSERLSITLKRSSSFHPESDGQTERINAMVEQYLRAFMNFHQDDWYDWLPLAEFALNNTTSETTGISPFFANYGFHPRLGVEPSSPAPPNLSHQRKREFLKANEIADRFDLILTKLKALAAQSIQKYEDYANRTRTDAPLYKEGDKVWVSTKNMKTNRPMKKGDDKWDGPYKILKVYKRACLLQLPTSFKIFPVFHNSLLRPLHRSLGLAGQEAINEAESRRNQGRILERDDETNEETERWEFDKLLDCHNEDGFHYQVKWKHHPASWQPAEDLRGQEDTIIAFHLANPDKPEPPAWVGFKRPKKLRQLITTPKKVHFNPMVEIRVF